MEALRPEWSEDELSLPKAEVEGALSEPVAESPQAFSFAHAELATEAMKKLPEAKLVHVEQAAGRGEAVERVYERRQEVRDEPGAELPVSTEPDDTASQRASSVGSIIARHPYGQKKQEASKATMGESHHPGRTGSPTAPGIYDQAVRTGFVAGLMIVIFFALLLILS